MNIDDQEVPLLTRSGDFGISLNRKPRDEAEEQIVWLSLADSFAYLFACNPDAFTVRLDNGEYCAVHRGPTVYDWLAHLCGYPDKYMVAVPLRPDGTVYWAAIDIDRKDENDLPIDWGELARRVTELKLPSIVVRSSGGKGCHLFCFFSGEGNSPSRFRCLKTDEALRKTFGVKREN
jgi:TOTE conflict system primase-like protein